LNDNFIEALEACLKRSGGVDARNISNRLFWYEEKLKNNWYGGIVWKLSYLQ
jgi:hypothetical protein